MEGKRAEHALGADQLLGQSKFTRLQRLKPEPCISGKKLCNLRFALFRLERAGAVDEKPAFAHEGGGVSKKLRLHGGKA